MANGLMPLLPYMEVFAFICGKALNRILTSIGRFFLAIDCGLRKWQASDIVEQQNGLCDIDIAEGNFFGSILAQTLLPAKVVDFITANLHLTLTYISFYTDLTAMLGTGNLI